jgi:hypothetical protein
MWQTGVVLLVLLVALVYVARHFVHLYRSSQPMCTGCSGCSGSSPAERLSGIEKAPARGQSLGSCSADGVGDGDSRLR